MPLDPISRPALTVAEVAEVYGIGRRRAYELCRLYLVTDGADGIPAIRLGEKLIRCPTAAVMRHLGLSDGGGALPSPDPAGAA